MAVKLGQPPAEFADTPEPQAHDEVAAKRAEHQLVDLGGKHTEALLLITELEGALDEAKCRALLQRIQQRIHENEADLARLMCEAKKQLRGSDV